MIHTLAIAFAAGAIVAGVSVALMRRDAMRRRLEEHTASALRQASEAQAAERLAHVGSMTAGLAHEIKNPLSTIGLNAQLLREAVEDLPRDRAADDADRATLARRVDGLAREAERLSGILTDFLEYAGELHLEVAPVDLNGVAQELADFFLPQAEQAGVRLRFEPSVAPVLVTIDAPHVKQAALNLMLNGVQAMLASGRDGESKGELILRVVTSAESVALHVIDTGPGIPSDAVERMFTPYFTTKAGGTGLGLPTTRRIVEAHGGRVNVHTDPAVGTDFAMVFPIGARG
ncbi:MAG: ATP-binding protein [Planctomycetota bacterium]